MSAWIVLIVTSFYQQKSGLFARFPMASRPRKAVLSGSSASSAYAALRARSR